MYWDGNGFWLLYKRLEKGRFQFPIRDDGIATITKQQLRWLLEGLRMEQKKLLKTSYLNTHKTLYLQSFYAHLWYNTYVW